MVKRRFTVSLLVLAAFAIALAVACTKEVIKEVPVEKQVVVEKEVVKIERVEVPVERIVEVVREVVKEVEVEVPVIVEKEVVREVEVPVQVIVEKEVIKEVEVPGETIIVETEVVTVVEVEKIVTVIATAIPTKKFSKEDFPVPGSILTIAHETVGPAVYHRPNAHAPWYTAMMHFGIGDALVDYDGIEDSGMIAESWDIDQDKVVWHIQRGIPWHDAEYGTVSASDVQWSYEEANREGTLIPYGQYFTRDFENPQILDSHTLQWDWKEGPVIGYTWLIRHWNQGNPIMSQDYYDDVGEEAVNQHITGTGPFQLISHAPNDLVHLEGVKNHWQRSPGFETVRILEVPEETTRIAMLQSAQVDALNVTQPQITVVEEIPGVLFVAPSYIAAKSGPVIHFGGNWIMTETDGGAPYENTPRPDLPWVGGKVGDDDFEAALKVRQAMSYAIDREEMLQEILGGKGCLAYAFGMDNCNYYWPGEALETPFDVDKAKALLVEAGYPDGFDVTFWNYSAPATDMGQGCEAVANYWTKNLGLTVNIDTSAYQIHRPKFINLRSLDFVWCFGAYADIGEPAYYLDLIPDATAGRVLSNLGYDYPESLDLMDRLSVAFDNADAWAVIQEYLEIMGPEGYFYTFGTVAHPVGGVALGPTIGSSGDMNGLAGVPFDFFTLEPAQ